MSKRKTASKHARSPKIAAKAQRAAQAIVKSPKVARRSVSEAAELAVKPNRDAKPPAPVALETSEAAMEENVTHTMTDKSMSKQFELSSAVTANVRAYQAKLIEMTQTNFAFSFEFSHRLASVRSPVELFTVIAEFTGKRIALIGKYSKEMIELGAKGTS